jgi:hypothetical protein
MGITPPEDEWQVLAEPALGLAGGQLGAEQAPEHDVGRCRDEERAQRRRDPALSIDGQEQDEQEQHRGDEKTQCRQQPGIEREQRHHIQHQPPARALPQAGKARSRRLPQGDRQRRHRQHGHRQANPEDHAAGAGIAERAKPQSGPGPGHAGRHCQPERCGNDLTGTHGASSS